MTPSSRKLTEEEVLAFQAEVDRIRSEKVREAAQRNVEALKKSWDRIWQKNING